MEVVLQLNVLDDSKYRSIYGMESLHVDSEVKYNTYMMMHV